jgi:hypothetical protein
VEGIVDVVKEICAWDACVLIIRNRIIRILLINLNLVFIYGYL